ncbi:MAG: hypothetical protein ABEL51_05040, partial [Salinibacter sp.]
MTREKRSQLKLEDYADQAEDLAVRRESRFVGLEQYFTPEPLAAAIASKLTPFNGLVLDPTAGNGRLLAPVVADHRAGIDIDKQALDAVSDDIATFNADFPKLLPYLNAVGFQPGLLVLNPPFSLKFEGVPAAVYCIQRALEWHVPAVALVSASNYERLRQSAEIAERSGAVYRLQNVWAEMAADVYLLFVDRAPHHGGPERGPFDMNDPAQVDDLKERLGYDTFASVHADPRNQGGQELDKLRAAHEEYKRVHHDRSRWAIDARGQAFHIRLTGYDKYRLMQALPQAEALKIANLGRVTRGYLVANPALRRLLQREDVAEAIAISPAARELIDSAADVDSAETAPLLPLAPHQRLGYLENLDAVEVITDLAAYGLRAGDHVPVSVTTRINAQEFKRTKTKGDKEVQERFVRVGKGIEIRIETPLGELKLSESKEDLDWLQAHFKIPEIRTIAELDEDRYAAHREWLVAHGLANTEE